MCEEITSEWIYFNSLDYIGSDIIFDPQENNENLISRANQIINCNAVNTLGYFKNIVNCKLVHSNNGGIFIKKSFYNKNIIEKTRVKLICNWCSSKELCDDWNRMSKGNYIWNNIEITWEDTNIDFFVITKKSKKIILMI